jgi:peptidoglycan-N-acetylglucosamine deacetylase
VSGQAARGGLVLGAFALAAHAAPSLSVPLRRFPGVVTRLPAPSRSVSLTFDDGPHPEGTPAVLEALGEAGVTATFFVLGEAVRRHRGLVATIAADGHEIALHGDRHLLHALTPPWLVARDLVRGRSEVEQEAGRPVSAVRAPYGAVSLATLAHARRHHLTVAGWSRWGWDWRAGATPGSIAAAATRSLAGGEVILLHDSDAYSAAGSWRNTAAAVSEICRILQQSELAVVRFCDETATLRD